MPLNLQTGVTGATSIGAQFYAFSKWVYKSKTALIDVPNFLGQGYIDRVFSLTDAELELSAKTYDAGNMSFATGTTLTFLLWTDALSSSTVNISVETIELGVEVDGAQPVKLTGKSNGLCPNSIT